MTRRRDPKIARFIGRFIKKHREKKFPGRGGKAAAADSFGVSRTNWGYWEAGKAVPDDINQRKLARFFGVSLEELRGGERIVLAGDAEASAVEAAQRATDEANALHAIAARHLAAVAGVLASTAREDLAPTDAQAAIEAADKALLEWLRSASGSEAPKPFE